MIPIRIQHLGFLCKSETRVLSCVESRTRTQLFPKTSNIFDGPFYCWKHLCWLHPWLLGLPRLFFVFHPRTPSGRVAMAFGICWFLAWLFLLVGIVLSTFASLDRAGRVGYCIRDIAVRRPDAENSQGHNTGTPSIIPIRIQHLNVHRSFFARQDFRHQLPRNWPQAQTHHRVARRDAQIRVTGSPPHIRQSVGRAGTQPAPGFDAFKILRLELRIILRHRATMPRTRAGLMSSFSPAISIVPPMRNDVPIGVTATRASQKMAQICGNCLGLGSVRL